MGQDGERVTGESGDGALYRRLWQLARPFVPWLALLLVVSLFDGLAALLVPLPLKIAFDSVIGSRPLSPFWGRLLPGAVTESASGLLVFVVVLLLAVALLSNLLSLAAALLRGLIGEHLVLGFRCELFRHAQRLSASYHDDEGTADANYRIQKDAAAAEDLLINAALPLLSATVTVGVMLAVTLWVDWQLGLVAAVVVPLLLFYSWLWKGRLRQQSREVRGYESAALAVVQEVLSALRVVKAFGQEAREGERFLRHSRAGVRARLRLLLAEGGYGALIRLTTAVGTAAVLYLGVSRVREGMLSPGDLLLVLAYLAQLYDPLKTISRKAGGLQSYLASAERAFELLDRPPDVEDRPDARPLARAAGALTFLSVSFGYEEERTVLRNLSFAIQSGTRLGIIGATGAGKTTLLNLLLRFNDPDTGQILLDGHDLRDYRLADLRHQFALVLQETVLFSASVAENIAYGRPDASREEVEAAARAAQAHDFITQLPQGYDTRVGERGMRLSGGERQRVAIARAFLKDAPVLLLDEPTSAVDAQTEAEILGAMERLMRGRTCILISHRPTPLTRCDSVLSLVQGRLVAPTAGAPAR